MSKTKPWQPRRPRPDYEHRVQFQWPRIHKIGLQKKLFLAETTGIIAADGTPIPVTCKLKTKRDIRHNPQRKV